MIVSSVELLSLKVPLHTPFKTAVRQVSHIHDLVVKIHCSDGSVGYGSAPSTPQITGDDHASIKTALENVLVPMILHQSLAHFESIVHSLHDIKNAGTNAKAAMEIALFDAYANCTKQPLYKLLQSFSDEKQRPGKMAHKLETDYTISVNELEQMCRDIDTAVARGYRCLKIKIGSSPRLDLERLKGIYAHTQTLNRQGIALTLRLDVNQGWDADTTVLIMQRLEQLGIYFELVEQPLKAGDISGLAQIRREIITPVMADESAFNLKQVQQLYEAGAVDIINIKLMKTGGLYPAIEIANYCRANQLTCMIGCMLEGSIGVAAAAHLAIAYKDIITLVDLDGPTLGQYDPIAGATLFKDANIVVNSTPGLGISAQQPLPLWREV